MQQSRKTVIFFAILMIVTGALIFAYPFISNALETRHATVAVQAYQQSVQTLQKEDIDGLKEAAKRYDLRGVCAVGMAVCKKEDQARQAADNNVGGLPFFYLRGGYAPEKLSGVYRLMMKPMARMVEKAPAETEEQRALRDAFAHGGDWVSQEALSPVLDWLSGGD